jgi:hypothetical protein
MVEDHVERTSLVQMPRGHIRYSLEAQTYDLEVTSLSTVGGFDPM